VVADGQVPTAIDSAPEPTESGPAPERPALTTMEAFDFGSKFDWTNVAFSSHGDHSVEVSVYSDALSSMDDELNFVGLFRPPLDPFPNKVLGGGRRNQEFLSVEQKRSAYMFGHLATRGHLDEDLDPFDEEVRQQTADLPVEFDLGEDLPDRERVDMTPFEDRSGSEVEYSVPEQPVEPPANQHRLQHAELWTPVETDVAQERAPPLLDFDGVARAASPCGEALTPYAAKPLAVAVEEIDEDSSEARTSTAAKPRAAAVEESDDSDDENDVAEQEQLPAAVNPGDRDETCDEPPVRPQTRMLSFEMDDDEVIPFHSVRPHTRMLTWLSPEEDEMPRGPPSRQTDDSVVYVNPKAHWDEVHFDEGGEEPWRPPTRSRTSFVPIPEMMKRPRVKFFSGWVDRAQILFGVVTFGLIVTAFGFALRWNSQLSTCEVYPLLILSSLLIDVVVGQTLTMLLWSKVVQVVSHPIPTAIALERHQHH